jgi:hypothetical protein
LWCRHTRAGKEIYAHKRTYTYSHTYEGGDEREHIHISGDSSPICKRHLESMLKGIKSYLYLMQTGHVDIEKNFDVEGKGRDTQHVILF